ncbi:MAG: hypothetical protein ACP5Q1_09455 [Anaerolineae bacterium]
MERSQAVDSFLKKIVSRAYKNVVSNMLELLERGPGVTLPDKESLELHDWYTQLSAVEQQRVQQIIQRTAFSAVFGVLVVLDNSTSGYALENEISDFALYVYIYSDYDSYSKRIPQAMIQLNDLMDLHEGFKNYLVNVSGDNRKESSFG